MHCHLNTKYFLWTQIYKSSSRILASDNTYTFFLIGQLLTHSQSACLLWCSCSQTQSRYLCQRPFWRRLERNFQTTIHRANERFVIIFPLVHDTRVYSFCCTVVCNCCLLMFTTFWKDIHHKWTEISDVCTFGHWLHIKKYHGTTTMLYFTFSKDVVWFWY